MNSGWIKYTKAFFPPKKKQMMMKCKEGWDYIQQHKVSRDLAATLPCLLYDTEAFVRRATLDAISCLIENRSSQGMLMETEDSKNQNSLK